MPKFNRHHRDDEYDEDVYDNDIAEDDEYKYEDDEVYDDGDDNRRPIVKYAIIAGSVVAIIALAIGVRSMNNKPADTSNEEPTVEQTTTTTTKSIDVPSDTKPSQTTPSIQPKGKDEASATKSLERSDAPLTVDDAKIISDHLVSSIAKIKADQNVPNSQDTGLYLTESGVFNLVKSLMIVGYDVDASSLKAYKSNNDNVQQFTVNFVKDGASPITMTGNWAPSISQIGLVQVHGEIPSAASLGDKPQVDDSVKNDSDKPEDWKRS